MEYKIGDIITSKVTGIQSYGVFVAIDKNTQGLIHISECRHGYVTNLEDMIQVGEEVEAMIIDIDEYTKKISLSLRALDKLDIPSNVKPKKHRRRRYAPQIGFETLRKVMPTWIAEAQQDEQNRLADSE
ncbi:CvfD/Ygs/GSP13 family RNA-binding post-transcriptional regulator [Jeotgalibaca sp. A127]|uniref:CvfD/Ygs/GSP13 family RNA-binding post-transcriptional regulator n=1 Tax=Jeotgalibaca sp. A127 TaxID=3457324 RepID=UPI003FD37D6F